MIYHAAPVDIEALLSPPCFFFVNRAKIPYGETQKMNWWTLYSFEKFPKFFPYSHYTLKH